MPVKTRDGEVWITQHAVDRFADREESIRRGDDHSQFKAVAKLRSRMKGGRIQLTRPTVPVGDDADAYLVTAAYVWPLRNNGDSWLAVTTIYRT